MPTPRSLTALVVATALACPVVAAAATEVAGAATITLPDLQVLVPTGDISIGTNPDTGHRQLQFTHVTWDAGTGPFAIQPHFNAASGLSSFRQVIYKSSAPGTWSVDHSVALARNGIFEPPSDYRFPLTRFTLSTDNGHGAPGTQVAVSPKVDYCITGDAYVGGVPNTPSSTVPPQSNCTSASALLGFSVGWGDQYDQTDDGQPIDLHGIADGTYVLRATVDPQHLFSERTRTNDVVDTTVQITGDTVAVLAQHRPAVTPPAVAVTTPHQGATVRGMVPIEASATAASPAKVAWVQYLLDGNTLGPRLTVAPYRFNWAAGPIPGTHTISAQATDTDGTVGTAAITTVRVAKSNSAGLGIDSVASGIGHGAVRTGSFSASSKDVLIAFASLDGPQSGRQSTKVVGLGIAWRLVKRVNSQAGDAEVWTATAPRAVHDARVTSQPRVPGFAQQVEVVALSGAAGIGASAGASAPSGAPGLTLPTRAAGSLVLGVGSDWDHAIGRTVDPGQALVRQWVDAADGDTFWSQVTASTVPAAGTKVLFGDLAPMQDRWDLGAVEVRAAPMAAPVIQLVNPVPGESVSGRTQVAVVVHDLARVRAVRFSVDGRSMGSAVRGAPFALPRWDSRHEANGLHVLTAIAVDAVGGTAATRVSFRTANPAPTMTCFVLQARARARGGARIALPPFHLAAGGERLMAFVRSAGNAGSTAAVTGAGARWRRLRVVHGGHDTLAVWTARSSGSARIAAVVSTVSAGSQDVTVVALEGTDLPGATAAGSGAAPQTVGLVTASSPSLVFAFGTRFGGIRHAPRGWSSIAADLDGDGWTTWVQYTNQPARARGTRVSLPQGAQGHGGWATVAVELPGDD